MSQNYVDWGNIFIKVQSLERKTHLYEYSTVIIMMIIIIIIIKRLYIFNMLFQHEFVKIEIC